jgi:hypothetical protein
MVTNFNKCQSQKTEVLEWKKKLRNPNKMLKLTKENKTKKMRANKYLQKVIKIMAD